VHSLTSKVVAQSWRIWGKRARSGTSFPPFLPCRAEVPSLKRFLAHGPEPRRAPLCPYIHSPYRVGGYAPHSRWLKEPCARTYLLDDGSNLNSALLPPDDALPTAGANLPRGQQAIKVRVGTNGKKTGRRDSGATATILPLIRSWKRQSASWALYPRWCRVRVTRLSGCCLIHEAEGGVATRGPAWSADEKPANWLGFRGWRLISVCYSGHSDGFPPVTLFRQRNRRSPVPPVGASSYSVEPALQ